MSATAKKYSGKIMLYSLHFKLELESVTTGPRGEVSELDLAQITNSCKDMSENDKGEEGGGA